LSLTLPDHERARVEPVGQLERHGRLEQRIPGLAGVGGVAGERCLGQAGDGADANQHAEQQPMPAGCSSAPSLAG
jgi:hypothetical protein